MTDREQTQCDIAEWLRKQKKFNDPVTCGLEPYAKGKARTIVFGHDCFKGKILILSNCILVNGKGPACTKYCGRFDNFESLKKKFEPHL